MAKRRRLGKVELAKRRKRQALDMVLRTAMIEVKALNGDKHGKPGQPICLYDCAIWLLYACTRDEARVMAQDLIDETPNDPEMQEEAKKHTPAEELAEAIDAALDDRDAATTIFDSQQTLAKELDPGYEVPIIHQDSWI